MTDALSHLTLGVEEEFHLVDLETRRLVARAPEVLDALPSDLYSAELQRCVVETNTHVVDDLDGLRAELVLLRRQLVEAADGLGPGVASSGTVPLALPAERGSTGFARTSLEADDRERRSAAVSDVADGVERLVELGVAEHGRIAVRGRSYGGYLTLNPLATYPELFAAGVASAGWSTSRRSTSGPSRGSPTRPTRSTATPSTTESCCGRCRRSTGCTTSPRRCSSCTGPTTRTCRYTSRTRWSPRRARTASRCSTCSSTGGHDLVRAENRATQLNATVDFLVAELGATA